ncbi:MAG: hypothetical protein JXB35_10540 [Anaerolineae bacterium]|nr:hypothetical protein [Anaerolineae bacterium]
MNDQLLERAVMALEGILHVLQGDREAGPSLRRNIDEYATFDWGKIGAQVVASDAYGPTIVVALGCEWKRRSHPKFGNDIWYSRSSGRGDDGEVKYLRLITFGEDEPVEPLPEKLLQRLGKTPPAPPSTTQTQQAPPPPTQAQQAPVTRPYDPSTVRQKIMKYAEDYKGSKSINPQSLSRIAMVLDQAFAGEADAAERRHAVQEYLTGHRSLTSMTAGQIHALLRWLKPYQDDGNAWIAESLAEREARRIFNTLTPSPLDDYFPREDAPRSSAAISSTDFWKRYHELKAQGKIAHTFDVMAVVETAKSDGDWNAALSALMMSLRL